MLEECVSFCSTLRNNTRGTGDTVGGSSSALARGKSRRLCGAAVDSDLSEMISRLYGWVVDGCEPQLECFALSVVAAGPEMVAGSAHLTARATHRAPQNMLTAEELCLKTHS